MRKTPTALALLGLLVAPATLAQLAEDALIPHGHGLARPGAVLFHPTEDLAVVTGDHLVVVAVDPGSGALAPREVLLGISARIELLPSTAAFGAWSVDGSLLYRNWGDGLTVFTLDPEGGSLRPTQVLEDGVDGVTKLSSPRGIAASGDGRHVYVANFDQVGGPDRAVAVLSRDLATGLLSFQSAVVDDNGITADGLSRASAVALTPDDADLYVLTDFAGDNGIARFDRDPVTGDLTFGQLVTTGDVAALDTPRDLVVSPDGEQVYVAASGAGVVAVFDRDPGTGALTFLDSESVGGSYRLAIRPDGAFLTVLSRSPYALTTFARDPLTGLLTLVESVDDGDLGAEVLGSNPSGLDYGPGGAFLAVVANDPVPSREGRVSTLVSDAATGVLSFADRLADQDPEAPALLEATDAAFDTSGEHLYATSWTHGAVTVLGRGEIDGRLEVLQTLHDDGSGTTGLGELRSIAVSPDDLQVVVAGQNDDVGAVLDRDPATGLLTPAGTFPFHSFLGEWALRFGSDEHLYGGSWPGAATFYRRDPMSGSVVLEGNLDDGVGPIDGLARPEDLELSPDGRQIYFASSQDSAIAVIERDSATGSISFLDAEIQGLFGVDGLLGVRDVVLSPDGLFLYAVAPFSNALTIFSRHPVHGLLSFVGALVQGVDGVEGLERPQSVALVDGGRLLVVGSEGRGGLSVFERDPVSGMPNLVSLPPPTLDPDLGFDRLVVAPDGRHLVGLHFHENALSVYAIAFFADGFESGDTSAWSPP